MTRRKGLLRKKILESPETSQTTPSSSSSAVNELSIIHLANGVKSYDKSNWLPATVGLCDLLSDQDPIMLARVLDSNVVPFLILFLTEEDFRLQLKAAEALKYIASGTSQSFQMTIDVVHPLPSAGMMIGSSVSGPLTSVHNLLSKDDEVLKHHVNLAQDTICHLLHTRDNEVLRHVCCALGVLSGFENVKIRQLIRESDVYNRLIELIRGDTLVVAPLHILGNIVEGDGDLIDRVIREGMLLELRKCLNHEYMDVRKEACLMISCISAGNEHCKQSVIEAGLIEPLVSLIEKDKLVVMVEALQAIQNATSGASLEQIMYLVTSGCIEVFCHLICCRNSAIFEIALKGIEAILDAGEKLKKNASDINPYADRIASIEGWVVLSLSATHYGERLQKKVFDILERYEKNPSHARHLE